ncbi:MAG: ATP synthase F1 subunit delta [Dehalococcoidia bacterium]
MADPQAGKRYAQAAFDIATRDGTVAQWRSDLEDIAQVLAESAAAPVLMDSKVPLDRRLAIVDRILDVQPLARNFARLLVQKGRAPAARDVATAFARMADEAEGVANAEVVSAVDLTPDQVRAMEEKLSQSMGKRVHVTATTDPAIIGGIVVKIGDRLIDGSVRSRLRQLKRELSGAR